MSALRVEHTPLHPPISTVAELDAWLTKRIARLEPDCYEGETIGHIGHAAHHRSLGAMDVLRDLRGLIAAWADEEATAAQTLAHTEAVEQRIREQYGDGPDAVMSQWQREGR